MFSAVLTHWPKSPKIIVYDYACELQRYCISREPEYFKDTLFLIDLFHEVNHAKCSECHSLKQFKIYASAEFFNIASTAAETGNSFLRIIRDSCAYMSLERFMVVMRLFIEILNRNVRRTMDMDADIR